MEDYDAIYKVVIVGDPGTGKSSLINRFVDNHYTHEYMATIGVDFKINTVEIGCKKIKLQMWDTAGQERFKSIVTSYYRGMNAALVTFDLNNADSFHNVGHWVSELKTKAHIHSLKCLDSSRATKEPEYILVGAKSDLVHTVHQSDIDDMVKKYDMKYFACSSKQGSGVEQIFTYLSETLYTCLGDIPVVSSPPVLQERFRFRSCCQS